jgi:hypothetical protein
MKKHLFTIIIFFIPFTLFAQIQNAIIKGVVLNNNEIPIANANVLILGKAQGVSTSDSGTFLIKVPIQKAFALIFTHTGYAEVQKNFFLKNGEEINITIHLNEISTLDAVTIFDEKERKETGLIKINPQNAISIPSTTGGVEGIIKTLVGSNNELTSNFSTESIFAKLCFNLCSPFFVTFWMFLPVSTICFKAVNTNVCLVAKLVFTFVSTFPQQRKLIFI